MLARIEKGSEGRRRTLAGQESTLSKGSKTAVSKVGDKADEKKTVAVEGRADLLVDGTNQVSVTFWTPDGSGHEGKTSGVGNAMLFVESKHSVSVGTDITIRLTEQNECATDGILVEGTVVWTCPAADDFKNREGFGLRIHGHWPHLSGAGESKGLA